ncbi:hypothetical protein G9464_02275 [Halostella sp. JP-L12]|uniref:hypothetical protein n=1 Tax=Halostella sp. JP-L12 TaxID=2716716 RepID=UPI00140CBEA7|nr:hypothetical protein [Halostella sp. JP-L12]NHN46428.1 hypothetical protein [Halostella sp. JP-L12]
MFICVAAGPGTVVATADQPVHDTTATDTPVSFAESATVTGENNSTQHENPDRTAEDGDTDGIERWLTNRLGDRLADSTIQLSQGEYDIAREYVGDNYSDRLGQLVDVEGETSNNGENDPSSTFDRAQRNQNEYISSVQEYRETHERYERAKQNGNESGARQLARQLDELSEDVNTTSSALLRDYENISNTSDSDLREEGQIIENVTINVTATQREIRSEEFLATDLTVSVRSTTVSFLEPLVATGRVTTANGTTLTGETVELRFGNRTQQVTTDGAGNFSVLLRPTIQSLDEPNASIHFRPEVDSIYLGTEQTVPVEVKQVRPAISIDRVPPAVKYNETVTVTGSVSAENISAGDIPVVVSIGDERLGAVRTDTDGTFSLTTRVPADVPTGSREINASLPLRNRALGPAGTDRNVTVLETNTSLTLSGTMVGSDQVRASGTLSTVEGIPVGDQSIEISVNGSVVETVRTDENGSYDLVLDIPSSALEAGSVRLSAIYVDDETNIGDTRAEQMIAVEITKQGSTHNESTTQGLLPSGWWISVFVALAVLIAVGGIYLWRHRTTEVPTGTPSVESADSTSTTAEQPSGPDDILDTATAALEEGNGDRAIELAYGDIRHRLSESLDLPSVHTHWEFYQACESSSLDKDAINTLERLTESYERAAYAPESLPHSEADAILSDIRDTDALHSR